MKRYAVFVPLLFAVLNGVCAAQTDPKMVLVPATVSTGKDTLVTGLKQENFKITEKVNLNFGAMFDNIFNHPLFAPIDLEDDLARIGSFSVEVDQTTRKLLPIKIVDLNPNFGQLNRSFKQEGFDNRRSIRLTLRLTF